MGLSNKKNKYNTTCAHATGNAEKSQKRRTNGTITTKTKGMKPKTRYEKRREWSPIRFDNPP